MGSLSFYFRNLVIVSLLFTGLTTSLYAAEEAPEKESPKVCAATLKGRPIKKFRIGSLNVENVFDPTIDINRMDKQFVPNAVRYLPFGTRANKTGNYDWTREKLDVKVSQIARMVKAMGSPALMGMVELENDFVAQLILRAIGYDGYLMTNSPDDRGVDVALFYKESPNFQLRFTGRTALTGEYYDQRSSRDILEAGFIINQKYFLWGSVNHWPSQMGPAGARVRAAQQLMSLAHMRSLQMEEIPADSGFVSQPAIFAIGDFNVIDEDRPHAFNQVLLAPNQPVSFLDVGTAYRELPKGKKQKQDMPPGTYYFVDSKKKNAEGHRTKTGTWNELDRIFVNSFMMDSKNPIHVDVSSYKIHMPEFARMQHEEDDGTKVWIPRSYDFKATEVTDETGVTDHFGITVDVLVEE